MKENKIQFNMKRSLIMNREKIQKKIETGDFIHINGSVLRTLNVIPESRCRLSSLEYLFRDTDRHCLIDSIKYLDLSGYAELTDSETGKKTDFRSDRFDSTEISLTSKGIQVLRGAVTDDCIDV